MEAPLTIDFAEQNPKYLQIVDSIIDAIRTRKLYRGQRIPSINGLSEEYLLSRDTVEKAYKELRRRGIITSVKGKGYFVDRTDIQAPVRVLLLFNKISNYKKQVYNSFVKTLGEQAKVDLHIHHFNAQVFESLILNSLGRYNYYVIMPHFYEDPETALKIIGLIPQDKLILLDRTLPKINKSYAAVYQDFENDICDALYKAMDSLLKYKKLNLVFPELIPYPPEIVRGFRKFCMQTSFNFSIMREINLQAPVNRNEVYIVIEETDLVNLIKKCQAEKISVGKDVGIISYNETPLKEILLKGITVISTDHEKMGETAARMILDKDLKQIKNPFTYIKRYSL